MSESYLSESAFKDKVIGLILRDRTFLAACSPILTKKDFEVSEDASRTDRIKSNLALMGLDFYEKYKDPLGSFAKTEIHSFVKKNKLPDKWKKDAKDVLAEILRKKIKAPAYIIEKVIEFKKEQARKIAISKLIHLKEAGELDDAKWNEVTAEANLPELSEKFRATDYFKELDKRIERRKVKKDNRFPLLFIEDLDRRVRIIARSHVGLILAPYKRGKSACLMHIAKAYVLQKLNVLYFTLEDPKEDVEDRFDASITHIPLKKLSRMPKSVKQKFKRYIRFVRRKLKIVDATDGGLTVDRIQSIVDQERNNGFFVDAVIIDYDEELNSKKHYKERRMEFDEIYRDIRRFAARNNYFVWLAAQSKRGTQSNKIVTGDDAAEDISKIKKSSCVLSLGQGEWGEDSIYVHVAAHKYDKQHIGVNIISNMDKALFYDPVRTAKAKALNPEMKRRDK